MSFDHINFLYQLKRFPELIAVYQKFINFVNNYRQPRFEGQALGHIIVASLNLSRRIRVETAHFLILFSYLVPQFVIGSGITESYDQSYSYLIWNTQNSLDLSLVKPANHKGAETKLCRLQTKMGRGNANIDQGEFSIL